MQRRAHNIQPRGSKERAIGMVVGELRRKSGISQEELSAECGFDRTYISRVERSILNPTTIRLWKISEVLKVPFQEMVARMEMLAAQKDKERR